MLGFKLFHASKRVPDQQKRTCVKKHRLLKKFENNVSLCGQSCACWYHSTIGQSRVKVWPSIHISIVDITNVKSMHSHSRFWKFKTICTQWFVEYALCFWFLKQHIYITFLSNIASKIFQRPPHHPCPETFEWYIFQCFVSYRLYYAHRMYFTNTYFTVKGISKVTSPNHNA